MNFSLRGRESQSAGAYQDIKYRLHQFLIEEIDIDEVDLQKMSEQQVNVYVNAKVMKYVASIDYVFNAQDIKNLTVEMIDELSGFGPLQRLIDDDQVNDILVNGPGHIFVERNGRLEQCGLRFIDEDHMLRIVRRMLAPLGRRVDESSPIVDARLPDGSRVNVIVPPLALNGSCISIRKFRKEPFSGEDLVAFKTLSADMLAFLLNAAEKKTNIMISGGTGTGKTTLLNLLSRSIRAGERVVTIEDAAELKLNHEHVVRLETRPRNLEGSGEVTARDLVRNALRMRPDRIILGEVRGTEVIDVLQAMNTGHEGSMSTIHANNPSDALLRIELLSGLAGFRGADVTLRKMIAAAIDLLVQVSRLPNGERRITSIVEVLGVRDEIFVTSEVFGYDSERDEFLRRPTSINNPKLRMPSGEGRKRVLV